jgi:hypothetical protein
MRAAALLWLRCLNALDTDGKAIDGAHLSVLERGSVEKVILNHVEGIIPIGNGPLGILAQLLLHTGFVQSALRGLSSAASRTGTYSTSTCGGNCGSCVRFRYANGKMTSNTQDTFIDVLAAEYVQGNAPFMRPTPMLKQINALPGSERHPAVDHGNRQLDLSERRSQVRRHVVGAFVVVIVEARIFRRDSLEECFQIRTYFRRRVLLYQKRCRRVGTEYGH